MIHWIKIGYTSIEFQQSENATFPAAEISGTFIQTLQCLSSCDAYFPNMLCSHVLVLR